jgi:hypothetical protein
MPNPSRPRTGTASGRRPGCASVSLVKGSSESPTLTSPRDTPRFCQSSQACLVNLSCTSTTDAHGGCRQPLTQRPHLRWRGIDMRAIQIEQFADPHRCSVSSTSRSRRHRVRMRFW